MNKNIFRIIVSVLVFVLLVVVSNDQWGFERWQSYVLGTVGYLIVSSFIRYTQMRKE